MEVGPGPGGITRSLLARGAKEVHVIEKDERFLPSLRLLQEASRGALKINMGDVLNYNISSEWSIYISYCTMMRLKIRIEEYYETVAF